MAKLDNDSGLWKRGILLFALVTLIALGALVLTFYRPGPQQAQTSQVEPEYLVPLLVNTQAPFPSAVEWGTLADVSRRLPSSPGWETRYNATLALARRGNLKLPLDLVQEMLNEKQQMANFRVQLKNGQFAPDETAARRTVLSALDAFASWHEQVQEGDQVDLQGADVQEVYQAISRLESSPNPLVSTEARKVAQKLGLSS